MRRSRLLATLALATALVAFPLGALASHDFADVPDSNIFHADISALVDAGVTSGCGGGNYCPSANVTREQMAAFLNRLGALAPGKTPVVNAALLDGLDSSFFLQPGDLVTISQGGWQLSNNDSGSEVLPETGYTEIFRAGNGSALIQTSPEAPRTQHGVPYGFKSVEFCFDDLDAFTLDLVLLYEIDDAGTTAWTISDGVDKAVSTETCFTYSRTPTDLNGFVVLYLDLNILAGASAFITTVTWTWGPTVI